MKMNTFKDGRFEKDIFSMLRAQDAYAENRQRLYEEGRRDSKNRRSRTRKFDSLEFRTPTLAHLNQLEKEFGVSIYDNPLIDRYRAHLWASLNVHERYEGKEDLSFIERERKGVRTHLAKALREGRRISNFLSNGNLVYCVE